MNSESSGTVTTEDLTGVEFYECAFGGQSLDYAGPAFRGDMIAFLMYDYPMGEVELHRLMTEVNRLPDTSDFTGY